MGRPAQRTDVGARAYAGIPCYNLKNTDLVQEWSASPCPDNDHDSLQRRKTQLQRRKNNELMGVGMAAAAVREAETF